MGQVVKKLDMNGRENILRTEPECMPPHYPQSKVNNMNFSRAIEDILRQKDIGRKIFVYPSQRMNLSSQQHPQIHYSQEAEQ